MQKFQLVPHRQVMIGARFQTFRMLDDQVGLKSMTRSAAGHFAQGGIRPAADVQDALRSPKQKGKLQEADRLLGVDAGAFALDQQGKEILLQVKVFEISGQRYSLRPHWRFHQRRLGQFEVLVGHKVVIGAERGAFHELAAFSDQFLLDFRVEHSYSF